MKLYISRINGYALAAFWLGFILSNLSQTTKTIEILLLTITTLMWLFNHDIVSHERVGRYENKIKK